MTWGGRALCRADEPRVLHKKSLNLPQLVRRDTSPLWMRFGVLNAAWLTYNLLCNTQPRCLLPEGCVSPMDARGCWESPQNLLHVGEGSGKLGP